MSKRVEVSVMQFLNLSTGAISMNIFAEHQAVSIFSKLILNNVYWYH